MRLRKVFLLAALLAALNLSACSGSLFRNYGSILPSGEVDREMEAAQVRSDMRYFTSGSDLYPNALIGLHRDCRLDPEALWKEVSMTPEKLRTMVGFMKSRAREFHQYPYGYDLIDPQGRKVGFWYAIMLARTYVRFSADGTVMVQAPPLETYDQLEHRDDKD